MIIFTSICANYIHKARILAKSVKQHMPDANFVVCLVEREISSEFFSEYFDSIILAKDAWEGNFDRFIFKHDIVEASTSVKGQFFRFLYQTYPNEQQFIYLDPDCYVYSDLVELKALLEIRPIVLCPHLLQPGNIDMELSSTAHGVYNLGFLGVNRSNEAQQFIDWWASRLYLFCYADIQKGIFTDQKWIDLAPCFFDVEVFKHRGYDFAPWSLLNCDMTCENGNYYVKDDSLRFIHFSGFGSSVEKCIRDWLPEGTHPFKILYKEYSELHQLNDSDCISKHAWSYASYDSGEAINHSIRVIYRSNYDVMFQYENPFDKSNEFYKKVLGIQSNGHIKQQSFLQINFRKAKKIYKMQGFSALLKKCVDRLKEK